MPYYDNKKSKFYSQVQPSAENLAVSMLAKDIQIRNQRKVKVNAQVTFVIYILETIANFSIFIVWTVVHGYSSEVTVTMGVMWFHIVLPYIFLMNTSHNKNLLIDDGWWNTVKNALGISLTRNNDTSTCHPISLSILSSSRKTAFETVESHRDQTDVTKNENNDRHATLGVRRKRSRRVDATNSEVSPILMSSSNDDKIRCSTSSFCYDSTKFSAVETKTGSSPTLQSPTKPAEPITKEESDSEEEAQLPPRTYHLELGESLLSKMINSINNEDEYLHYLTQLSELEENFEKHHEFVEEYNPFHIVDYPTRKKGKIKSNHPKAENIEERWSKNVSASKNELNVQLLGRAFDRLETRKSLFENYQEHCNDEVSYKKFCDMLFDFEENLICDKSQSNN